MQLLLVPYFLTVICKNHAPVCICVCVCVLYCLYVQYVTRVTPVASYHKITFIVPFDFTD